eukprot:COSAG02_NODE_760_length_17479_cov_23.555178_14_plen_91_part_00
MLELAQYNFRIEFIPGCVNDVADGLSRLLDSAPNATEQGIEFRDYLREQDSIETASTGRPIGERAGAGARVRINVRLTVCGRNLHCSSCE